MTRHKSREAQAPRRACYHPIILMGETSYPLRVHNEQSNLCQSRSGTYNKNCIIFSTNAERRSETKNTKKRGVILLCTDCEGMGARTTVRCHAIYPTSPIAQQRLVMDLSEFKEMLGNRLSHSSLQISCSFTDFNIKPRQQKNVDKLNCNEIVEVD